VARAATLWRRPEIRAHERLGTLAALGAHAEGRAAVLDVLEREPDALVASLPPLALTFLPFAVADGCDPRTAERLEAALAPRLASYPQMRRSLAQVLETIRICAAERDASGAEAGAFFAAGLAR
jgi:hypothetical protein